MKKRFLICLVTLVSLFIMTGCDNINVVNKQLSCHSEVYLFHSKKYVEHNVSLDKSNKIIQYKYIEKYFEFDETGGDFELICTASPQEAENNNKMYKFLNEVAECNRDSKEVVITDVYDITKLESKNPLPSKELKESLDDNYILDVDSFKTMIAKKGYTCEEK